MILVTGATGYVGRHVVCALSDAGRPVRALLRSETRKTVLISHDAEIVYGDVLEPSSLRRACENVDTVIHLVAAVREKSGTTFHELNYKGTRNILDAASSTDVKRFVQASAIGAGPEATLPYFNSRWMAEREVKRSGLMHTIVRFSIGFGEGDEFFNLLAAQVKLSPLVPIICDGRTRLQPISVVDMARCLIEASDHDALAGQTIEAAGPEVLTYEEAVDLIAETLGVRISKVHIPMRLMKPIATVMNTLMSKPPVTPEQLKMLDVDNTTVLDSVQSAFGFKPRSIRKSLSYITKISLMDALKINMGFMPECVRDH